MKVIVAGLESSGSTAVWQAAGQITNSKIEKFHGFKVINGHHLVPIRNPRDILASLYRRRVFGPSYDLDKYFLGCLDYLKPRLSSVAQYEGRRDSLYIKYEDWVTNEGLLVDKIANFLGVSLSPSRRSAVVDYICLKKNTERAAKMSQHSEYNPETHIHGRHITSHGELNTWQVVFSRLQKETVKKIEDEISQYSYLNT